jgi:fructose-1,6-bisphosphatase/inositol monophosphatase family enzyme
MEQAALEAGEIIKPHYGKVENIKKDISHHVRKGLYSLQSYQEEKSALTELDEKCQILIMKKLAKNFSSFGIHVEESNAEIEKLKAKFNHSSILPHGKYTFLIDPIDGTRNFLNTNPKNRTKNSDAKNCDLFAVCINLAFGKEIIGGVIHFPKLKKTISCLKGNGVFINGKLIKIFKRTKCSIYDPVKISNSLPKFKKNFKHNIVFGSSCGIMLALLEQRIYAYLLGEIDILDFGITALAYEEAGGLVLDKQGKNADLTKFVSKNENGSIFLRGFLALAPSKEYYQKIKSYL